MNRIVVLALVIIHSAIAVATAQQPSATNTASLIVPAEHVYGVPFGATEGDLVAKFGQPTGRIALTNGNDGLLYGDKHLFVFRSGKLIGVQAVKQVNTLLNCFDPDVPAVCPLNDIKWTIAPGITEGMTSVEIEKLLGKPLPPLGKRNDLRKISIDKATLWLQFAASKGDNPEWTYSLSSFYIETSQP